MGFVPDSSGYRVVGFTEYGDMHTLDVVGWINDVDNKWIPGYFDTDSGCIEPAWQDASRGIGNESWLFLMPSTPMPTGSEIMKEVNRREKLLAKLTEDVAKIVNKYPNGAPLETIKSKMCYSLGYVWDGINGARALGLITNLNDNDEMFISKNSPNYVGD